MEQLSKTWDLDVFFSGGSDSPKFAAFAEGMERDIARFAELLDGLKPVASVEQAQGLIPIVELQQQLLLHLREASAFTSCLTAQNTADKKALQLNGRVRTISAAYESAMTRFDQKLVEIPGDVWERLLKQEPWKEIAFGLNERRELAQEKLPPEQEALVSDLAVDGYHGWGELYDTAVSHTTISFEENGRTDTYSVGQAFNKMHSPDRDVRVRMFEKWEEAWADKADFCADALNRLAGFRLQLYKHRGWDSVLKEPLAINRMSRQTLDAMWQAIERSKPVFVEYLQRKAKLYGLDSLQWFDVDAPVGEASKTYTYEEGAEMILEQFGRFSPKMAEFAKMAFDQRWIEVEDRPGKRPGGFCTSFPASGQTRIFMTYSGTADNVSTLAHELGHAYHQHVMNELPALSQEYAMNVAETASTFAEMIVSDAAVRLAPTEAERLTLIEDKLQRAVAFFMNIHARFLFETRFYDERKKGLVSVDRLSELMLEAQKEAFNGALGGYHPLFWASKLHFYITEVPFYNFPYTFGFLFSAGIYAYAQKFGQGFEDRYAALLKDTGRMTVEELASKHLDVDLTKPDFWERAVELSVRDAQQFLQMTEGK